MALSPMMQQYMQVKEQYKDAIVFTRLGDFYEMFFEDAEIASKVLDLTLTGRACGLEERAPMCGVPYHAAETYISKLITNGYKVAIYEQITEPQPGKMVERAVVRVITSGTVMENEMLDEKKNNYIASVYKNKTAIGVAYCDITTGEFKVCEFTTESLQNLNDLLVRVRPAEIICNSDMVNFTQELACVKLNIMPRFSVYLDFEFEYKNALETLKKQFNFTTVNGFDFGKMDYAISASGALIRYIIETQKRSLNHINRIITEKNTDYLYLDITTCRNLEIVETIRDQKKRGSLLWLLDNTKSSMGARLMRNWVLNPLKDEIEINGRLNAVEELTKNPILHNDISSTIAKISDIERLAGKIAYGSVMPRDCLSLKNSLKNLPDLATFVQDLKAPKLARLFKDISAIDELTKFLDECISEDAPAIISAGGFIKAGFNKELDEYRAVSKDAQLWLSKLETTEREQTGIKNLKIGYNRVFGYYIEVNKSQQDLVPFRYQRKQTIANNERYITEELKQLEDKILNADDFATKLEQKIFTQAKEYMQTLVPQIQRVAEEISILDCICSLAHVATKYNYTKPVINSKVKGIDIKEGRHPVVEALLKNEQFVPNDTTLDGAENRTMIITGPNMAGKSTYMRQVAIITLLAHIGSFVPAQEANICLTDRIFTRIGASDDLAYGQSTFMVEMVEVANIINNATKNSLLILDEVGRGTSTFDGLSIAWAVLEYITKYIKAKTLFATHYHEMTDLEGQLEGVKNYRISVKEYNNSVIFLRKIVRGGANKSFGIEVAGLAGINNDVILRAKEILHSLEEKELSSSNFVPTQTQYDKIIDNEIVERLKTIDMNKISPMVAFELLNELVEKAKE